MLTPEQRTIRSLAARVASNRRWANEPNRQAAMAPAHRGFDARFEREVDPDGLLDPVERARRAENARKAYFAELTLKSVQARARRKKQRGGAA